MADSNFSEHIVVPVADDSDAEATAKVLEPYDFGRITVLFVVEKGEGVPDKTPVEQSERIADEAFAAFRDAFPDAETELRYRRDVVRAIVDAADDLAASAIVFRPRGGGRLIRFLAGDRSLRLISEANTPVVSIRGDGGE